MKQTIVFILILIFTACSICEKPAPGDGVSKRLANQRAKVISELNYNLSIVVPEDIDEPIDGQSIITFDLSDKQTVYLDFKATDDQLHQVIINNDTITSSIINEHIKLDKSHLVKGKNTVQIKFTLGDGALNRNNDYFYALFVPDRARTAIPCFDQPDIKGRFSVKMDLPETWTGVANGEQTIKQVNEGRIELIFAPSRPLSTYLWAFTAGKYQYTSRQWMKKEIGLFHMVDDTAKFNRNVDEVFRQTLASLDWLEDFTEHDYPFATYNLVAIPSFQFGGMEHPGATYYRSEKIFLDENPTRNEELSRANLIAHETAHMWFGDLVTMPWFDEVWLKEVFANFIADKITQPWFPEMNHSLRFLMAHFPSAYSVDRTEGANPIGQQLANLKNAGTLYGGIIYHKSPIVMMQLENIAGEANLKKGIQEYVKNHAYGNASWDELIAYVDKYTETDLKVWSNAWVYEPGRPVIFAEPSMQNADQWKLSQTTEYSNLSSAGTYWPQTINIIQNSDKHLQYEMFDASIKVNDQLDIDNTLFLADESGYGLVRLTEPQLNYWLENTPILTDELLKGRMVINLYENFLDGTIHPDQFIAYLIKAIPGEKNPLILSQYTRQLQSLFWKFVIAEKRNELAPSIEQMLWENMISRENIANKKTLFRAWQSICTTDQSVALLADILSGKKSIDKITLSENDKIGILSQLYIKDHSDAEALSKQVTESLKSKHNKEKLAFILPSLSQNAADRDAFFISLSKLENRRIESWVQSSLRNLHHPLRAEHAVNYLQSTLNLLEEIQLTGDIFFPIGWLGSSYSGHGSEQAYNVATQFLKDHPDYPQHLKLKILQNIDMTQRAANIKKKYY